MSNCQVCGKELGNEGYNTISIKYVEAYVGGSEIIIMGVCNECRNKIFHNIYQDKEPIAMFLKMMVSDYDDDDDDGKRR